MCCSIRSPSSARCGMSSALRKHKRLVLWSEASRSSSRSSMLPEGAIPLAQADPSDGRLG